MNDDKLFKFIINCSQNCDRNKFHAFTADIKHGKVYVKFRKSEVYIRSCVRAIDEKETITEWIGYPVAAANRLDLLGIDFESISISQEEN